MKVLFILLLILPCHVCHAQKKQRLRCPPPAKLERYNATPTERYFFKAELGIRHSLMYRNPGGYMEAHYKFIAVPQPYIGLTFAHVLDKSLSIFAGATATQTMQGLSFKYTENGFGIHDKSYMGSFQCRFSAGLAYSRPLWKVYASPSITYNSFFSSVSISGQGANSGSITNSSPYSLTQPGVATYDRWGMGIDLSIERKIAGKFYAAVNTSVDFHPSVSSSGSIWVSTMPGQEQEYQAQTNPYLYYIGIGINYRIFQRLQQ